MSENARSALLSPLKSPTTTDRENETGRINFRAPNPGVACRTGNGTSFDIPPPGAGFDTVIVAVRRDATFAAGTGAVSSELLTKVVVSALPSQFTTAPETKPVPLTCSMNVPLPGFAA